MVTEMTPISSSVVAAFLLLGFWNAGTPLLIASTPVSAAQPEENARSIRKASARPPIASYPDSGIRVRGPLSASGSSPRARR